MSDSNAINSPSTKEPAYCERLVGVESVWWKKLLDVQRPYRWNLRKLNLGFTLDIGCGIGRNLKNLDGVGIDHNPLSVSTARARGLRAFTPEEFESSAFNQSEIFDSILVAHVIEHLTDDDAAGLLSSYLDLLKPEGRVVLITPQELGFHSDPTHINFSDFSSLRRLAAEAGLSFDREYSFPFPRFLGRLFRYNEFVSIHRKARSISGESHLGATTNV